MKKLNKATVLIIASMLVLALTLVATFSWFPRVFGYDTTKNYKNIDVKPATVFIKASQPQVKTYQCNFVDGKLDEAHQAEVTTSTTPIEIKQGKCVYFRSVVTYSSQVTSNVSLTGLALSDASSNLPSYLKVCALSPLKTIKSYSDNMTLVEHLSADNSLTSVVEWYLYNSGTTVMNVTFTSLPQASVNG